MILRYINFRYLSIYIYLVTFTCTGSDHDVIHGRLVAGILHIQCSVEIAENNLGERWLTTYTAKVMIVDNALRPT